MKKFILGFIHNGLKACGFGPIIWSIVYFFLEKTGVMEVLEVRKAIFEIVTVTLLAFIAGGINIVYHMERLPLMAAISAHGVVLYLDYTVIYLINGWLGSGFRPFLVFTGCFFVGYAIVWVIIYLAMTRNTNRLNQKLAQLQKKTDVFRNEK